MPPTSSPAREKIRYGPAGHRLHSASLNDRNARVCSTATCLGPGEVARDLEIARVRSEDGLRVGCTRTLEDEAGRLDAFGGFVQ